MGRIFLLLTFMVIVPLVSAQEAALEEEFENSPDFKVYKYKGQTKSITQWDNLKPIEFLDFGKWKKHALLKLKEPNWKIKLRDRRLVETVGRILDCFGECRVYRGRGYFKSRHKSAIKEGDELHTIGQSYAWLFLMDGTIVRLSPGSSITLKEINIGRQQNFLHVRINSGNILWLNRSEKKFVGTNRRESDTLFLPLKMYDANPPYRKTEVDEDNLFALIEESQAGMEKYKRLNSLIEANNEISQGKKTYSLLVMPNGTLFGKDLAIELTVLIGEESYVKLRPSKMLRLEGEEKRSTEFFYRGFENTKSKTIDEGVWYRVGKKGRHIDEFIDPPKFRIGELVTSNIPSILIARELMFKKYSNFAYEKLSAEDLAEGYGYRQWGDIDMDKREDMGLRMAFLHEYTRRIETTNLLVSDQFRRKLKRLGEKIETPEFSRSFYSRALQDYLIYQESLDLISSDREVLHSTENPYWKRIHERR